MSFISIKGKSIRLSNIKEFGISYDVDADIHPFETVYRFFANKPRKKHYYLYITNYQGDNTKFYGSQSDVTTWHKQLEKSMSK